MAKLRAVDDEIDGIDGIDGSWAEHQAGYRCGVEMTSASELTCELETVAAVLQAAGRLQLAETVSRAVEALRQTEQAAATEQDLLTTIEAAKLLGVRSINTIKQWASQGRLEGHRLGSRVLVTRRSVEQLRRDRALSPQHDYERELEDALALIDYDAEEVDDLTGFIRPDGHGNEQVSASVEQASAPHTVPPPGVLTTGELEPPILPGADYPVALAHRGTPALRRKGRSRPAKRRLPELALSEDERRSLDLVDGPDGAG